MAAVFKAERITHKILRIIHLALHEPKIVPDFCHPEMLY
jgi:hypothetical protein